MADKSWVLVDEFGLAHQEFQCVDCQKKVVVDNRFFHELGKHECNKISFPEKKFTLEDASEFFRQYMGVQQSIRQVTQ